ncbi:MAG: hypothetical protein KUG73_09335 [Pseudomonadales bacterium]|nr:hypothetical protein [Pseudomonadales bacterium]
MNFNTKSLIIGWFSALILLWLVVALNSNASTITPGDTLQSAKVAPLIETKRQGPLGF